MTPEIKKTVKMPTPVGFKCGVCGGEHRFSADQGMLYRLGLYPLTLPSSRKAYSAESGKASGHSRVSERTVGMTYLELFGHRIYGWKATVMLYVIVGGPVWLLVWGLRV